MYNFDNKTVIVTGGATGIGYAIATSFLQSGANVVIVGRRKEVLDKAILDINSENSDVRSKIIALQCDVSIEEQVRMMFKKVIKKFEKLNILVNCSGTWLIKPIHEISSMEVDEQYYNLYKSTVMCTKYASKNMNVGGAIINIGSFAGLLPIKESSIYSSLKTAINTFTKSSAQELGNKQIRVNCVIPGVIRTSMTSDYIDANINKLIKPIVLGKIGKCSDIANSVLFLASENASYITGSILQVTGGKFVTQI